MQPIKEFTYKGYTNLLEIALNVGYDFVSFSDVKTTTSKKFCVLRHDIDASLNAAYEMASIEAKLGIKATYFIMLRSPIYNLFSRTNHQFVQKIIDLGHEIGIHYDEGFYAKKKELNSLIEEEALILQNMFEKEIGVVSFHQPSLKIINNELKINKFINTYDRQDLDGVTYISDSNKVWKESTPWEIFDQSKYLKMHLLIHPMWWMINDELSTEEIWSKTIVSNFKQEEKQVHSTERAYGDERDMFITAKQK
ncbi:MAG TPA: hypothetical protein VN698_11670 [Bacteroidia bacterium]|nr:hypothetical protein [Bacteroidia bacterium]